MLNLTPQEKLIIIFVGLIALSGVTLEYYRKSQPRKIEKLNRFIEKNILKNNQPLNINTAAKGELIKIPGIGEKTAQAIIDYRDNRGKIFSFDELSNVKGLNKGRIGKIKNYLVIE